MSAVDVAAKAFLIDTGRVWVWDDQARHVGSKHVGQERRQRQWAISRSVCSRRFSALASEQAFFS